MAASCSNDELPGQFSTQNDDDFSDFCGSDSDEEARDNNVYGYPNDFEGRNFAENVNRK